MFEDKKYSGIPSDAVLEIRTRFFFLKAEPGSQVAEPSKAMSSNEEIERLYFQMMQETQPPQPLFMNPNELHSANYLDPPLLTTSDQPDPGTYSTITS